MKSGRCVQQPQRQRSHRPFIHRPSFFHHGFCGPGTRVTPDLRISPWSAPETLETPARNSLFSARSFVWGDNYRTLIIENIAGVHQEAGELLTTVESCPIPVTRVRGVPRRGVQRSGMITTIWARHVVEIETFMDLALDLAQRADHARRENDRVRDIVFRHVNRPGDSQTIAPTFG